MDSVSSVLVQPVVQATGEVAGKMSFRFHYYTQGLRGSKILCDVG